MEIRQVSGKELVTEVPEQLLDVGEDGLPNFSRTS